jgi:hypothetical protein
MLRAGVTFDQPCGALEPLARPGSSLFGVDRNVLRGQRQIEFSSEQVDHGLEVSD